jgi:branched-chain amino acid transport system permease protein
MKTYLPWLVLLVFASVPMWLKDPYLLNAFITTGIFIV